MKKVTIRSKIVGREGSGTGIPSPSSPSAPVDLFLYLKKEVWDDAFELKETEDGVPYLFGKLPVLLQYGLTMYADPGNVGVPSLFDGIPIDNNTIYWEETTNADGSVERVLKAKIGTGEGGSATLLGDLENVGAWANALAEEDRILVQKKGASSWTSLLLSEIKGTADFSNVKESGAGNAYTSFTLSEDKKTLTFLKGETFAKSSDLELKWTTDGNKISNWNTAFGWGDHSKAGYSTKTYVDETFVTLKTEQTITGKKDFTGGLMVNGSPIVYDKDKKYWKLTGDLLVTGALTMFANEGTYSPSTIMDGVLVDDSTIIKDPTTKKLMLNPDLEIGGGGLDETALASYLSSWAGSSSIKNVGTITSGTWNGSKIANVYLANSSVTISGESVSLGGSISQSDLRTALGLGSNAYTSTSYLPSASYTAADVLAKLKTVDGRGSGLDADTLDGNDSAWFLNNVVGFKFTSVSASVRGDCNSVTEGILHNYYDISYWENAPSGFDYGKVLNLRASATNTLNGQLAWDVNAGSTTDTTKTLWWRASLDGTWTKAKWHQVAFTDSDITGNAATATKLKIARTIWGQSFDGSGNITGHLYLVGANASSSTGNTSQILFGTTSSHHLALSSNTNSLIINPTSSTTTGQIVLGVNGNNTYFTSSGNFGIGTSSPSIKLHVNGDIGNEQILMRYSTTQPYLKLTHTYSGTSYNYYVMGNNGYIGIGATVSKSAKIDADGNVEITGNLLVKGGITMYGLSSAEEGIDGDLLPKETEKFNIGSEEKRWNEVWTKDINMGGNINSSIHYGTARIGEVEKAFRYVYTNVVHVGTKQSGSLFLVGSAYEAANGVVIARNTTGTQTGEIARFNSYGLNLAGGLSVGTTSAHTYITGGNYKLYVNGKAYVTSTLTQNSDIRYKEIHKDLSLPLATMAEAPSFEFHFTDDERKDTHIGTSAQYWKCVDGVVSEGADGRLGMDYSSLGVVMGISLAKELSQFESDTDRRIRLLEEENKRLKKEIEQLKTA